MNDKSRLSTQVGHELPKQNSERLFHDCDMDSDEYDDVNVHESPGAQKLFDGLDVESDIEDDETGSVDGTHERAVPAGVLGRKTWRTKAPRALSPAPNLAPHEHYFYQTRPGGSKTSDNTIAADTLVDAATYRNAVSAWRDRHEIEVDFLHDLHGRSFHQWAFELGEGFNICLYGWGSKRKILLAFAEHLDLVQPATNIMVVDGHSQVLTLRGLLASLVATIPRLSDARGRLTSQPSDVLTTILDELSSNPPASPMTLLIHSIDGCALRRANVQSAIAHLAAHDHIRVLATADTLNFPMLWDASLMTEFNWLFHDCTTFRPYDNEIETSGGGGIITEVDTLLGRSGHRMHGRDGVMFVLKSLTQSARGLFALLVKEITAKESYDAERGQDGNMDMDNEDDAAQQTPGMNTTSSHRSRPYAMNETAEVEWRALYQKAVAQFIATNETSFRGLLKEFKDHEIIVSRRDALGTELLSVPFRREDIKALMEELVGNTDAYM